MSDKVKIRVFDRYNFSTFRLLLMERINAATRLSGDKPKSVIKLIENRCAELLMNEGTDCASCQICKRLAERTERPFPSRVWCGAVIVDIYLCIHLRRLCIAIGDSRSMYSKLDEKFELSRLPSLGVVRPVTRSRDTPRRGTNCRYFEFKRF
jgi:hypothetical protein